MQRRKRAAFIETLESRRLLTITIDSAGIVHGVGTSGDDTIEVGGDDTTVTVTVNGESESFEASEVSGVRLEGLAGNDTLNGGTTNDTLDGGLGADLMKGGGGLDTIDYSARSVNLRISLEAIANDGASGEGDNAWVDIETVNGGSGNDVVEGQWSGSLANNVLRGNGGNDLLIGGDGNDALFGGGGNDRLEAGTGDDYLEGNADNDALYGQSGTDLFLGHDGDDWIFARDGVGETLSGGNGFDRAERDTSLDDVSGVEQFLSDEPQPVFIENRTLMVTGTGGNDGLHMTVDFERPPGTVASHRVNVNGEFWYVDSNDFDRVRFIGLGGDDNASATGVPDDTTFEGGDGNDRIVLGFDAVDTFVGGAGDDTVIFAGYAQISDDFAFDGGAGIDAMRGASSENFIDLNDFPTVEIATMEAGTIIGNALDNELRVGIGTLIGGGGDDHLVITDHSTPSRIEGGDGDDLLESEGARDDMDGGNGNDTLVGGFSTVLKGGPGLDTLDYAGRTGNLRVTQDGLANDGEALEEANVGSDIETILGGSGNDYIAGSGFNNVLRGNGGNDFLRGFGGNDALYGGSGNDRLEAGTGNDYLQGDAGNDALLGEAGSDFFFAGDGDDWLFSRDGISETVIGGNGFDRAQRDPSDSVLSIEAFIA